MLVHLLLLGAVAAPVVQTFEVDGVEREALVYMPPGTGKHPLVFGFHGHGGNMRFAARQFGIEASWPEAIAVYPQGLPTKGMIDPDGTKNGWQQNVGENGDRDLKFFDAMMAKIPNVDPDRVYVMGHSNGGRMTYLLWAERGRQIAAFGPSGSPAGLLVRRFKPASAFITAGEKDPIVDYRFQSRTIQAIRSLVGADASNGKKDGYVTLEPAKDGMELGTYIHPGGHEYPHEAAVATVELFKRHRR